MPTPLSTNTDKLIALKEKVSNLPEYVPPAKLQEKTVTPTKEGLGVVPDSGFDGMSKVTVNGDNNLVPENIKEGVSIFGVEGNYKGNTAVNENKSINLTNGSPFMPGTSFVYNCFYDDRGDFSVEEIKLDKTNTSFTINSAIGSTMIILPQLSTVVSDAQNRSNDGPEVAIVIDDTVTYVDVN